MAELLVFCISQLLNIFYKFLKQKKKKKKTQPYKLIIYI